MFFFQDKIASLTGKKITVVDVSSASNNYILKYVGVDYIVCWVDTEGMIELYIPLANIVSVCIYREG